MNSPQSTIMLNSQSKVAAVTVNTICSTVNDIASFHFLEVQFKLTLVARLTLEAKC